MKNGDSKNYVNEDDQNIDKKLELTVFVLTVIIFMGIILNEALCNVAEIALDGNLC